MKMGDNGSLLQILFFYFVLLEQSPALALEEKAAAQSVTLAGVCSRHEDQ